MNIRHPSFHRSATAAFVMIVALSVSAGSQTETATKLRVGDPALNGSFIKPYKNAWRLTYTKPSGETLDAAVWSDEVEAVQIGGRALLKRTQVVKYNKRDLTTTMINVFDPRTMAPISRDVRRSAGVSNHIDFAGTDIKYQRVETQGGDMKQGEAQLDAPVFDFFGGMYGLLLAAAPLKTGYSATLPSLDEQTYTLRWATFRVTGEELVEAGPNHKMKAWVVETDDNGPMTFWLTKDAPYVIKLVYTLPGGVTATYTML